MIKIENGWCFIFIFILFFLINELTTRALRITWEVRHDERKRVPKRVPKSIPVVRTGSVPGTYRDVHTYLRVCLYKCISSDGRVLTSVGHVARVPRRPRRIVYV